MTGIDAKPACDFLYSISKPNGFTNGRGDANCGLRLAREFHDSLPMGHGPPCHLNGPAPLPLPAPQVSIRIVCSESSAVADAARNGRPSEAGLAAGLPTTDIRHVEALPAEDRKINAPLTSTDLHARCTYLCLRCQAALVQGERSSRGQNRPVRRP